MDKYTVLLVDDEEVVIEAIMKKLNWEDLGFSVVGYANNGVKALEMVEEYQPDVVMTDINMPYMSGMELAQHIKTGYPTTKLLILTGFDDFEYAKEAVHLEVEEYILKPINSIELTKVFGKLKEKLDQEISEKRSAEVLQKYYFESLPFLQADLYSSIVEGKVNEEDLQKYSVQYQVSMPGPFYCCIVIYTSVSHLPEGMSAMLLTTSVQKQAKEYYEGKWNAKCFSYHENIVLIAQLENENDITELTDDCDKFCKYARRMIGAKVTVGIGHVCNNISGVALSYSSAREAISYIVIYGAGKAINIKEIAPQEADVSSVSNDAEMADIFKMIRLGTEERVIEAIDGYLKHISGKAKSIQQHSIDVMEIVEGLYKFSKNNDIAVDEFQGDICGLYTKLLSYEKDSMRQWMINICLSFRETVITARRQSTKSFVSRAQEYVADNYTNEDLSLDMVCDALGVSNSYFSPVFNREMGKSFIGYLTDYRMSQAAKLLISTNEKSYSIAEKVGYADANYFSYVFKRRFGVSPSKYRTEHIEGE